MESIKKLEDMIAGWLKPIPHLPTTWRKWISENIWWLTLIGVILSILMLFTALAAISALMFSVGVVTSFAGTLAPVNTGMVLVASIVSLVFWAAIIALSAMAVTPLKNMKKKGWDLLFLVFVIEVASSVVSVVLNFNAVTFIPGLIGAAIGAAISAYFVFEIKSYFNGVTAVSKK